MRSQRLARLCPQLVAFLVVVSGSPVLAIGHPHVDVPSEFIIGAAACVVPIYFHNANHQPTTYTGTVTASVTHDPMGFAEFTRNDPYWNGTAVVTQQNTYVQGARVSHTGATPPYGTSISFQVAGVSGTSVNLGVYSFGTAEVTVTAGGKSNSGSVSDIWIQGRWCLCRRTTLPMTRTGITTGGR
ncbi:MAG TPA: hypothetical protein PLQ54_00990, partial [Armatimonadota bacterium]|nr:hypothetical protein [Armatimonadota bacterium]